MRTTKAAKRPGPSVSQAGRASCDCRREIHVLACDQPGLFLAFRRDRRDGACSAQVHTPSDTPVTTILHPCKGFDFLGEFSGRVEASAGASIIIDLPQPKSP